MPRGKKPIYDNGKLIGEKCYYYRQNQDICGPSKIWIEQLSGDTSIINIKNKEIYLPILNLSKYLPQARTYALIEEYENMPVTMIDIMYSDEDIIPSLENDDAYLNNFLNSFNRESVNIQTAKYPGLIYISGDEEKRKRFMNAFASAVKDNVNSNIFPVIEHYTEEEVEVQEVPSAKNSQSLLSIIKETFNIFTGKKPINKDGSETKKNVEEIQRKAIIFKSGATIIGNEVASKYCFVYGTNIYDLRDRLTIYLVNERDRSIFGNPERLRNFGNTLFESNILETFIYLMAENNMPYMFAGSYNEITSRIDINRDLEKYFDKFNDLLTSFKPVGEGR